MGMVAVGVLRVVEPPVGEVMVAEVMVLSFQVMSTMKPPRARRPVTEPVGHASGSEGRSVMVSGVD